MSTTDIFSLRGHQTDVLPIKEYLSEFNSLKTTFNRNVFGALQYAIGERKIVNTAKDERLGRMFSNRVISVYPAFNDFYGLEDTVDTLMQQIGRAADGYPQEKMLFYLHGMPSSGKTSLAERLLKCFERAQIWTLAVESVNEKGKYIPSPINEHPLGLFNVLEHGEELEKTYKIPRNRLQSGMSPWAAFHLHRLGSRDQFYVKRISPWAAMNRCLATADFSSQKNLKFLIGYAGDGLKRREYIYKGAFNLTTQGILELVEVFKADPELLKILLTATQDRWYTGDGGIGRLPYQGMLLSYSNTDDWEKFKKLPNVSAIRSRVLEIPVPLPTSIDAEMKILRAVVRGSGDRDMPVAPGSYRVAAALTVASRLESENRGLRLRLYNGDHPGEYGASMPEWSDDDRRKMTADDFRRRANFKEGLEYGLVIRQIQKWMSELADSDPNGTKELAAAKAKANLSRQAASSDEDESKLLVKEVGLDPVSLISKLVRITERERLVSINDTNKTSVRKLIEQYCVKEAENVIASLVRRAAPADYNFFLRDHVGRFFNVLDAWTENREYKDPETESVLKAEEQEAALLKIERHLGIKKSEAMEFRGKLWGKIEPLRKEFTVPGGTPWRLVDPDLWRRIEEFFLPTRQDLLPSEDALKDDPKLWTVDPSQYRDTKFRQDAHAKFVERFIALCTNAEEGTSCTPWQAQRMIQWWVGNCVFKDLV